MPPALRLRRRSHEPGECAASECSLLCNDFLRLGYDNMVVDPGIRLAYEAFAAQGLYAGLNDMDEPVVRVPVTQWRDIQANPIDEDRAAARPQTKCTAGLSAHHLVVSA